MGRSAKDSLKMFEQLLGPGHEAVNALLGPMPAKKAPSAGAMAAPTSMGYIKYGNDMFDGQGSGHDFYGNLYAPSIGWRNSTDGGRSILFPDYLQARISFSANFGFPS